MNFLRKVPLTVANEAQLLATTSAITNISAEIPTNKAKLAAHILTLSISPMPALSICTWLASRPWSSHFHTFPGSLCLNRLDGTSATAAQCILLEGFIRPADWTYHSDDKQCQFPTFGAYALGMEVAISDSFPAHAYAALDLLDRASKKGQLPVLIEALYRGKCAHLSLQAGGNDLAQLKIPYVGIVTASEKYVLTHSGHTGICFFAVTWDQLPPNTESQSQDGPTEPLPTGVPPGTCDNEGLPDIEGSNDKQVTILVVWATFQTGNRLMQGNLDIQFWKSYRCSVASICDIWTH